jgi:Flp pilus assembly pilin Flp
MRKFGRFTNRRRAGVTTVEYALMLAFFVMTAVFGIPRLADTVQRFAAKSGNSIETAAATR